VWSDTALCTVEKGSEHFEFIAFGEKMIKTIP